MNTNRLLTILIVVFMILNGVLYMMLTQEDANIYSLSEESYNQLTDILEQNDIIMYAPLPKNYPRAKIVILAPVNNEDAISNVMFSSDPLPLAISGDSQIHQTANEKLTFDHGKENGLIYYAATNPVYKPSDYSTAAYRAVSDKFVLDITLNNEAFEWSDTREGEGFKVYYYNERFQEELLFCNEVLVKIEDRLGITEARTIRYEPYAFEETEYALHSVDEVLYRFMFYIRDRTDVSLRITAVDIGYYLGPDDTNDLVSLSIEPYYRIKLGSGKSYYVNAYTNEVVE